MATEPNFIERDTDKITKEIIEQYEAAAGKSLQPAQAERLILNVLAYRETLLRSSIQDAALQMLLSFSRAPVIDYLGEIVGVDRLPAQPATCTLRFTLVAGHTGVTVPAGTRVRSADGKATFATTIAATAAEGTPTIDIEGEAQTTGTGGNGFVAGQINVILDPQPFLTAAANVEETAGGSAVETDDALRGRIKLAPASFSNAGSRDAYEFFARGASPTIVDVAVTTPVPGTVNVYPLVAGGVTTPAQIISAVEAAVNDETVRPLTDTVEVLSPGIINYSLEVDIVVLTDYTTTDVKAAVEAALDEFTEGRQGELGLDITDSKVTAVAALEGVYSAEARIYDAGTNEVAALVVAPTEFAVSTAVTVTVTGTSDE